MLTSTKEVTCDNSSLVFQKRRSTWDAQYFFLQAQMHVHKILPPGASVRCDSRVITRTNGRRPAGVYGKFVQNSVWRRQRGRVDAKSHNNKL